ncbi:inositol-trisphosphate 3-kinase homolog isoform X2 [Sitodiplosis mosellana]|uniref:inositol-trisphosphate 3-kinase homolog isoform X2 n=1 Tax=Sitodiplosis mosellana TaxID=263140 RepID=UPI002443D522|nr:inositol-trisphosphate 3-kinase homolog isoform X2 [Sitodiplosis mosellana]
MTTTFINRPMAWTNQRLKYTQNDCINLKALWKMLILNDNHEKEDIKSNKNALELSAPASPVLLLQQQKSIPSGTWLQLAGHPESIAPGANGIVRKRISGVDDSEAIAYRGISKDAYASKIVPKFLGVTESNGDTYLELQDLLHGFRDPAVMDIKMGRRTFLESEVKNTKLRNDLYKKMIAVAPTEPTDEEHKQEAVTKLRYMLFRERMSSSESKGFRIEALRMKGSSPITDLKTVKSDTDVYNTIARFLCRKQNVTKQLLERLKQIRGYIEKSHFFQRHEIVGSSIFIVYDEDRVGAWLIDFAKSRRLDEHVKIDHRSQWEIGNFEEGILYGVDQLISIFEDISAESNST